MHSSAHVHAVNSSSSVVRRWASGVVTGATRPRPAPCCCSQASSNWGARCIHNINAGPSSQPLQESWWPRDSSRKRIAAPRPSPRASHRSFSSSGTRLIAFQLPPSEHWQHRFLPKSATQFSSSRDPFELVDLANENEEPPPPPHPLEDALDTRGHDAAWSVFQEMTSTREGRASIPPHLIDRLWWSIAIHTKIRPQPTNAHLGDELQRLAQIWKLVDGIQGDRYAQPVFMDTLKSHRWLYLLMHRIMHSNTHVRLNPRGRGSAGPAYFNYLHGDLHQHLLDILQHMRRQGMLIHDALLKRLVEGMALSGRVTESIYLWDEQQHRRRKIQTEAIASAEPLPAVMALHDAAVEIWLDCIVDEAPWTAYKAQETPTDPNMMLSWALKVITMAMEASLTLSKRPLDRCMSKLDTATLLEMLPNDILKVMRQQGRQHTWIKSIAATLHSKESPAAVPAAAVSDALSRMTPHHKDVLAEIVAFQLAQRGEIRPAIAMHSLDQAPPSSKSAGSEHRLHSDTRVALLRGMLLNVKAAVEAEEQEESLKGAVRLALEVFDCFRKSSTQSQRNRRQATANIVEILSAVILLEKAQTTIRKKKKKKEAKLSNSTEHAESADGTTSVGASEWLQPLRRVTSSVLAADPQLNSSTVAAPTLSWLFILHATLQDYTFTKELWVKWQRLEVRKEFSRKDVPHGPSWSDPGYLPMYGSLLAWFLQETLDRPGTANLTFAIQIYDDWQASLHSRHKQHGGDTSKAHLPSYLRAKLLRRLTNTGMTHALRRIIDESQNQGIDVTLSMCKALASAFQTPDAFSAEQSIEIVDSLVQMYRSLQQQEEANTGATKSATSQEPKFKSHLPLETFTYPVNQVTAGTFVGWSAEWHARLLKLFQQFAIELESQMAYRATRPFNAPRNALITDSAVRSAFNGAMKTLLEWPTIPLFGAIIREMPSRPRQVQSDEALDRLVDHSLDNEDLNSSAQQDGDAKRAAILHLDGILDSRLATRGDWETWSLRLLAWMLPSSTTSWEQRKREALRVWELSLSADFDANHTTEVKPWARFEVADLHGRGASGKEDVQQTTTTATATTSKSDNFSSSDASDATVIARSSLSSSPTPHYSRSSETANSAKAIMRPILLRPSTTARFMLNLSLNGDVVASDTVYESYIRKAEEILHLYRSECAPHHHSPNEKASRALLQIKSQFRSLLWENFSTRRVGPASHTTHVPDFAQVLTDAVSTIKLARAVDFIWRLEGQEKKRDADEILNEARTCWIESRHCSVPFSRRAEDIDVAWSAFRSRVERLKPGEKEAVSAHSEEPQIKRTYAATRWKEE